MTTADYLDRGVKGGFQAIQEKMRSLKRDVEELEKKEKDCIAERNKARQRHNIAFTKMSELTMQMGEKEEQLRKSNEKLKYATGRLDEKEGHVTRIKDWNKRITTVPAEELEELEKHVKVLKENYAITRNKVAEGRHKATNLEDAIERREYKLQELIRREGTLRTECEHQQREYELKREREGKQRYSTRMAEAKLQQMENDYYNARRRHETSAAALVILEAKIAKAEILCEEFKRKRIAIDSTLRELLSSYSKDRQTAAPPNYPQSSFAVNSSSN